MPFLPYVLIILASVAVVALVYAVLDIHVAIYRPKTQGRTTYFYFEVGDPDSSHLQIPADKD